MTFFYMKGFCGKYYVDLGVKDDCVKFEEYID